MSSNKRLSLCYSTDYNINNIFILHSSMHKQCHIINFRSLHKNFQEDHFWIPGDFQDFQEGFQIPGDFQDFQEL